MSEIPVPNVSVVKMEQNNSDAEKAKESTKQTRMKGNKKKYEHSQLHDLSGYNKRQILNHLKSYGCTVQTFEDALRKFKVNKASTIEYFQKHIDGAKEYVHQECDSFCFENINAWLQFFEENKMNEACQYEHAIVMNAIAQNEIQPEPSELQGVDLREIYEFLTKSLLGLPQNELNEESARFLATEFESLIEEANTNAADEETRVLKKELNTSPSKQTTSLSLDPFQISKLNF